MTVVVVPYDPDWPNAFAREQAAILEAIAPLEIRLHHIGSTAIPGILAKPIIDLLAVGRTLEDFAAATPALETLGYESMGEHGIAGRRYFRKTGADGRRTHHMHGFAQGAGDIRRHLAFRDYVRAHPEVARAYSELKAKLTRQPGVTMDHYVDGKDAFVRATEADALRWAETHGLDVGLHFPGR